MSYKFDNPQDIQDIQAAFDQALAGTIEWYEAYDIILNLISVEEPADGSLAPKEGVDGSVWQFIYAAANINDGESGSGGCPVPC